MKDNELLYFTNEFNFNELAKRNYKPIDKEEFPFLWFKGSKIILPKPKINSMKKAKKFETKPFFSKFLNSLGASKQKRFLINYFMPITKREHIYFDFIGFVGFGLKGDFLKNSIWYNNPSQIESIVFSNFGVKCPLNLEKEVIIFQTEKIPNVPEVDIKLESFKKYTRGLQEFFKESIEQRVREGKSTISRYHTPQQEREFMDFYKNLKIVSAEDMLEKMGGEFFSDYVKF